MGDMVGEFTCKWLKLSRAGGHVASLCDYMSVTLHCPVCLAVHVTC